MMCVGLFQANVLAVYLLVQKYLRIVFELVFVLGGEVACRSMFGAKRVNLWVSLQILLQAVGHILALWHDAHARRHVFHDAVHQ